MSISTYAELQTAVASWLHRTDLTTQIPDFIKLAEVELNTEFRNRLMETDNTLTLTAGTRTIALPSGYIEPISLELVITGEDNDELTYVQPQQLSVNDAASVACRPVHWTVNGSNIEFANKSDITYTLTFRMLKEYDLQTDLTNSMLTRYPNVYLYGALIQAGRWTRDPQMMQAAQAAYEDVKYKIKKKEGRSKALTSLRVEMFSTQSRTNIIAG